MTRSSSYNHYRPASWPLTLAHSMLFTIWKLITASVHPCFLFKASKLASNQAPLEKNTDTAVRPCTLFHSSFCLSRSRRSRRRFSFRVFPIEFPTFRRTDILPFERQHWHTFGRVRTGLVLGHYTTGCWHWSRCRRSTGSAGCWHWSRWGPKTAGPGVALDAGIGPGGAQTAASNGRTVMKTNGATGWHAEVLVPYGWALRITQSCLETKASKSKVAPIIILVQPTFKFFPPGCPGCNLHTSGLAAGNEKH